MEGLILSHYEILEELGRGGMGIVYRAKDLVLERTVAIKVLPTASVAKEKDRDRLYREARAAAALQHPNIANVYQIDEAVPSQLLEGANLRNLHESLIPIRSDAESRLFIAMEFIEGLSLSECITAGDMPLKTVGKLARQAAEGLAAAHEKGIVHRDIKPSNMMVTGKMDAKILDFGIARQEGATKITEEGSTYGTIAYMSPEQAMGEAVDHRTDIWSLGVLIYEMLCSKLPFQGVYEQAVIYMIVNAEPSAVTARRSGIPEMYDFILSKCLAKDPNDRYQSSAELAVDLRSAESAIGHLPGKWNTGFQPKKRWSPTGWLQFGTAVIVAFFTGLLATSLLMSPLIDKEDSPTGKFMVPAIQSFANTDPSQRLVAISPQGTHIAHIDGGEIRIRDFSSTNSSRVLEGTFGAKGLFFSADGKWIAYVKDGALMKTRIEGGLDTPITAVAGMYGGHWASSDEIVFSRGEQGIYIVSAEGGTPQRMFTPDSSVTTLYTSPQLFPEKNLLIYTRMRMVNGEWDDGEVVARKLKSGDESIVWRRTKQGYALSSGHLIAYNSGKLWAKPFSQNNLRADGQAREVISSIMFSDSYQSNGDDLSVPTGDVHFSVSDNGTLVYLPKGFEPARRGRPVWVDSRQQPKRVTDTIGKYYTPAISKDGQWLVISAQIGEEDFRLYRMRLPDGAMEPFTNSTTIMPVFHPDDEWVYFSRRVDDQYDVFRKRIDDTSETTGEEPVVTDVGDQFVTGFDSIGDRYLIFSNVQRGQRDIKVCETSSLSGSCTPILATEDDERNAVFSPNDSWIAFSSEKTGVSEIYVSPVDDPNVQIQVSNEGGSSPIWSIDGSSIYYYKRGSIMAVRFDGTTGEAEDPYQHFESEWFPNYYIFGDVGRFQLHPDGNQFLLFEEEVPEEGTEAEIAVEVNWFDELRRELTED